VRCGLECTRNHLFPEDQTRVSIIIMHLVPENQRNQYLREISILAKAIQSDPKWREITTAKDLTEVRDRLLDLISSAKDTVGPAARARMIRLQRPKVEPSPITDLSNLVIEPVTLIVGPDFRPIVLTQHAGLAKYLETAIDVAEKIETDGVFQNGGWRIIRRSKIVFQNGRVSYDCLAITTARKLDSKER
jgi:PTS system nitrogen regulatory IIA component